MQNWRQAIRTPTAYRVGNNTIRMQTNFVYTVAILGIAVLILLYLLLPHSRNGGPLTNAEGDGDFELGHMPHRFPTSGFQYNSTYPLTPVIKSRSEVVFKISLIADLDERSKSGNNNLWQSYMKTGRLSYNIKSQLVSFYWDENLVTLNSSLSLGGRGMELSELVVFNGKLYSIDDRTGVIYEVENNRVIPWVILTDGDGRQTKGFKGEWATVKDQKLYIGGLGKEWTSTTGKLINLYPQWVKVVSPNGEVQHQDWHVKYNSMRAAADVAYPGYLIHEAAVWSDIHRSWFYMPRRASKERYDEKMDELRGTNILIQCDEGFSDIKVKKLGELTPSRGFSSFKFIPYTDHQVVVALKSEELNGKISTYITVVDIVSEEVLYPETLVGDIKYEGVEFV